MSEIRFWNRAEKREETEQVYGDAAVNWAYGSPFGLFATDHLLSSHFISKIYGAFQSSGLSKNKVAPFIAKFKIDMNQYEPGPFGSFNEFFIRKFRPGARPIESAPNRMPAFCEARYLAFETVLAHRTFPVKGEWLSARALLAGCDFTPFEGGPMLIARLCPTDYHRFHFPDSGRVIGETRVHGKLHSVNPVALKSRGEIFATNERHVTILDTAHFGKLAYVEVGALCVGKIVQTHHENTFVRGEEKGYFLFGASTVILLGERGKWLPDTDLLEQTELQRESFVKLGSAVAHV